MPGMHCIVTAGPTAEPLDDVRWLTNASTGRLGMGLGVFLTAQGCRVTLLRSRLSTFLCPAGGQTIRDFTTTGELEALLREFASDRVDAIFHVAAVSDFTFGRVYERVAAGVLLERKERKLGTAEGDLVVELKPTPKLIARLAEWFPKACRIGWKFELDGDQDRAIEAGREQIRRYGTQGSVVNGQAYGDGYGLVGDDFLCRHHRDADALYSGLWQWVNGIEGG